MTDSIIKWFKMIFIMEISGELVLKLVPEKYKDTTRFAVKLMFVLVVMVPLLNYKKINIEDILVSTDSVYNTELTFDDSDIQIINDIVKNALKETAINYGYELTYITCDTEYKNNQVVISGIKLKLKKIDNDCNVELFRKYIMNQYNIEADNIYIEEGQSE